MLERRRGNWHYDFGRAAGLAIRLSKAPIISSDLISFCQRSSLREAGLAFQDADLLLVGLAALSSWLFCLRWLVMSWFAAALVRPIDATLRIGVVLDISHEGILAFDVREIGL